MIIHQTLFTTMLRNGVRVLAHSNGYSYTFANRTQAERKAAELRARGLNASIYKHPAARPFYVSILETEAN